MTYSLPEQLRPTGADPEPETPIYDSLYAEYRRLFRSLPGDRSGEEQLRFTGFGGVPRPQWSAPPTPPRPGSGRHRGMLLLPRGSL